MKPSRGSLVLERHAASRSFCDLRIDVVAPEREVVQSLAVLRDVLRERRGVLGRLDELQVAAAPRASIAALTPRAGTSPSFTSGRPRASR